MTYTFTPHIESIKTKNKVFFVGDIHGQFSLLMQSLVNVNFIPENGDILISVGDLVDGGHENELVLALLEKPWFFSVLGNHEVLMLNALSGITGPRIRLIHNYLYTQDGLAHIKEHGFDRKALLQPVEYFWIVNGGHWFFDSIDDKAIAHKLTIYQMLLKKALPTGIQVDSKNGRFGVVHAEIPHDTWSEFVNDIAHLPKPDAVLWSRHKIKKFDLLGVSNELKVNDLDALIVGHSIIKGKQPAFIHNTTYMDIGAKNGNPPLVMSDQDILINIKKNNMVAA